MYSIYKGISFFPSYLITEVAYLVAPKKTFASPVFPSIPGIQELCDPMVSNMLC